MFLNFRGKFTSVPGFEAEFPALRACPLPPVPSRLARLEFSFYLIPRNLRAGVPSVYVEESFFYGNDRLEKAVNDYTSDSTMLLNFTHKFKNKRPGRRLVRTRDFHPIIVV